MSSEPEQQAQQLSEKGLHAALDHKRGANRDVARREVETIVGAYLAAARVAGCPDEGLRVALTWILDECEAAQAAVEADPEDGPEAVACLSVKLFIEKARAALDAAAGDPT